MAARVNHAPDVAAVVAARAVLVVVDMRAMRVQRGQQRKMQPVAVCDRVARRAARRACRRSRRRSERRRRPARPSARWRRGASTAKAAAPQVAAARRRGCRAPADAAAGRGSAARMATPASRPPGRRRETRRASRPQAADANAPPSDDPTSGLSDHRNSFVWWTSFLGVTLENWSARGPSQRRNLE